MKSRIRQIKKLFALAKLSQQFPDATFYGGPKFLRLLSRNHSPKLSGGYAQDGQDLVAIALIGKALAEGTTPRIFLDVGCNHPELHSNSLLFERAFSFHTIAIDAISEMGRLWNERRSTATFINTAVGEAEGTVSFKYTGNSVIESMYSAVSGSAGKLREDEGESRTIAQTTLGSIMENLRIAHAAIASIDVEGYELNVLKGIDFSNTKIDCIIIENNTNDGVGSNEVREFLLRNGYRLRARIFGLDDVFTHRRLD